MTAQGTFDRDRGEMEIDLGDLMGGLGAPSGSGTMKALYLTEDGDPVMYMQFGFLAGMLPSGKTWIRIDLQKAGKGFGVDFNQLMGGAGQNPSSSLDLLRSSGDFTEVGTETVDGVETTHYHGVVDLKKAAAAGGPASEAIQRLEQLGATTQFPMDVWIDGSGMIRRFTQSYDQSLGGQTMSLDTTMDISDYGTPVDVTAPPADQVFDATALAGQGAQSQPGATTTTPA